MADSQLSAAPVPEQTSPSPEELLLGKGKKERLGPWYATAICGNDITSSCLYVSAIAIVYAGPLAPVALLLAAGVLYLYRKIYTEVVEALLYRFLFSVFCFMLKKQDYQQVETLVCCI